jgi:hypothetical protein
LCREEAGHGNIFLFTECFTVADVWVRSVAEIHHQNAGENFQKMAPYRGHFFCVFRGEFLIHGLDGTISSTKL